MTVRRRREGRHDDEKGQERNDEKSREPERAAVARELVHMTTIRLDRRKFNARGWLAGAGEIRRRNGRTPEWTSQS